MDIKCKTIIWNQFGAAIDAFENAMNACPDDLWNHPDKQPPFWYVASHTLFWLDYYLSESRENFKPPDPFGLEEMDPAGVIPDPPYTKAELQIYLEHGREKCLTTIENLTEERGAEIIKFRAADITFEELLLYNMRHVQHHSAQLNLILRRETNSAPGWTFRSKIPLSAD